MTTIEEINDIDSNATRHGRKWTVNECLQLEREYDLLQLSVPEMAILHHRTINAIMCKLQDEELDTYNNLYIKTFGQDHINEQINKLNQMSSVDNDSDDEDYEPVLDDDDDDEDYESVLENELYTDANRSYIFGQLKRIHGHISNILGYFTKKNTTDNLAANY